jgi:hypothetical protein
MSSETETGIWPELCAEVIGALAIRYEPENDRFKRVERLYDRCVNTCIPNNVRATEVTDLRDQLKAFHAPVLESINHIQAGWPSVTRAKVRNALKSTSKADANPSSVFLGGSDREVMDKAIDVAICLWLSIDCVDKNLGAKAWLEAETVEQFVLKQRFVVAVEVDDRVRYFPSDFRAAFLKEISGIHIEQTYYLDQHLRFNEQTRTVKIFMDIGWLKAMIRLFQSCINAPEGSDGDRSHVNISGGQAHAGCQQNPQVDDQVHGDSQPQGMTLNTAMAALPTGNK